jgi:hypothetical protein
MPTQDLDQAKPNASIYGSARIGAKTQKLQWRFVFLLEAVDTRGYVEGAQARGGRFGSVSPRRVWKPTVFFFFPRARGLE